MPLSIAILARLHKTLRLQIWKRSSINIPNVIVCESAVKANRFGFPKVPMLETRIVRPLPPELPAKERRKYALQYDKIRKAVQCTDEEHQKY
jgi:hypothetical protein